MTIGMSVSGYYGEHEILNHTENGISTMAISTLNSDRN